MKDIGWRRGWFLGAIALFLGSGACAGEDRAATVLGVETDAGAGGGSSDAADPPTTSDASVAQPPGCSSVLTPVMSPDVPSSLSADGPWQRCGAYGAGPAKVLRAAADGSRAVVVTASGDAFVLTLPELALVTSFQHGEGRVAYAALSPDGRTLATLDDRAGRVAVWDVDTHALRFVRDVQHAWPTYASDTGDVVFSSTGAKLAVASGTQIAVFDVATGAAYPITDVPDQGNKRRLAFVADDTKLAANGFGFYGNGPYIGYGGVELMDADTGANRVLLPAEYLFATSEMATSRDGRVAAVSTEGWTHGIHFFDTATATEIPHAAIYGDPIALSPDGSEVALWDGEYGYTVSVRRVADGAVVHQLTVASDLPQGWPGGPVEITSDLEWILSGNGPRATVDTVRFADASEGGRACGQGAGDVEGARVSHDGTRLVTGAAGTEVVWDVASGARVDEPPPADSEGMNATSPDGRQVAEPRGDDHFVVRDLTSGSIVAVFGPQPTRVEAIDWSPDGLSLVSTGEREPVDRWAYPPFTKVWARASGELVQDIPSYESPAFFGPLGDRLFVGEEDTVMAWCHAGMQ